MIILMPRAPALCSLQSLVGVLLEFYWSNNLTDVLEFLKQFNNITLDVDNVYSNKISIHRCS